jgi:hypothetical protein
MQIKDRRIIIRPKQRKDSPDTFPIVTNTNIAHFFHERLFYGLYAYLKNKNIRWILDKNLPPWGLNVTLMCADKLNIPVTYEEFVNHQLYPHGDADIKKNPNWQYVLELVKRIAHSTHPDVVFTPAYKVLYFRNDADRRKMVGYTGQLDKYFDRVVYDFNTMSADEQMRLFMKCSHFVTIEGAATTNIIFMNEAAKMFVISNTDNSWQMMFGTGSRIHSFERMILNAGQFDDDIEYTDEIGKEIIRFITTS